MKTLLLILFLTSLITCQSFAQFNEEENESSESIREREEYIYTRRAGGPDKIIPKFAYSNALQQKLSMLKDEDNSTSFTASSSWVSVNPTGMFYLVTNNNYISGRTNAIAFHPSDPNTIYIAAAQGGVWKTTNGGVMWTVLTDNLGSISSGDIAIDPTNANILYYGTGELNYSQDSQYGSGIYKSTDAGNSWAQLVPATTVGTYISKIVVDFSNPVIVLCSGSSGIFRSTNSGVSWTLVVSNDISSLNIDPANSQIMYAATGSNASPSVVYKSTNNGVTWTSINNGVPTNVGRIQLSISPDNSNYIYASVATTGGSLNGLYRTTNAGTLWTLMASTPNYLSSQGWYDNAVTAIPGNINGVVVGGLDVYSSTNGGTTLTQRSSWSTGSATNFSHADVHLLKYNGTVLYCCSDGGVYKSTNNGVSWTDLNLNISTLQFQSADFDPTNISKLYGGTQDNNKQTSTNQGLLWRQQTTGDGGYTVVDPVNTNFIYGTYVNGSIQRSNNSGASYSSITPTGSSGGLFYDPYEMAPGNHNVIVFGRANVWKTTNAQTVTTSTWTQIGTTATIGGSVSAVGISWTNVNKIYIGTSNGRILVTTNNGTNWSVTTGHGYVSDFSVDSVDDNICYASLGGVFNAHVKKTINGGGSWTDISGNLPSLGANSIILKMSSPRTIFVGTDLGVFQSVNEGTSWTSFNTGFPNVEVYDLKYKSAPNIMLAATHGRGCFMFDFNNLQQTMNLTINFQACTSSDTIDVELRNNVSPFGLVESSTGIGGGGVSSPVLFTNAVNGTPYYIVVKHRNTVETWSGSAQTFTAGSLSYNFTTAASQAFGNNMILDNSLYSFYTGEVNQDGIIDVSDIVLVYNDALVLASGYIVTDLNCDSFVDVSDIVLVYNNSINVIGVITP